MMRAIAAEKIDRPWLFFACLALMYIDIIVAWQQPKVRAHVMHWIAPAPQRPRMPPGVSPPTYLPMSDWFNPITSFKVAPSPFYDPTEEWNRPRCGVPCIIKETGGGYLNEYITAVKSIYARHDQMRISVKCFSACALAAIWMRENGGDVCVTAGAVLGLHWGQVDWLDSDGNAHRKTLTYELPADIDAWTKQHGGLSSILMLGLHAPDIYRFFKACKAEVK